MRTVLQFLLATSLLLTASAVAGDTIFQSGPQQAHLLELFTSEGCSSCPPAEEHLSNLQSDPRLWKQIVPVAFHVDYWDKLGWPDRFASPAYTERQQSYAREWGSGSVYTPEFVLDGHEFVGAEIPVTSVSGGILTVKLNSSRILSVQYQPSAQSSTVAWQAHVATLGIALKTDVRAGENSGRHLRHDFVALSLLSLALHPGTNFASLTLPLPNEGEKAIAIWITQDDHSAPVQATGGWTR